MHLVSQREDLSGDFIIAASRTYGSAVIGSEPEIQDIVVLYAMISRMRIVSSPKLIVYAEKTIDTIMASYFEPKRTLEELRVLIRSGEAIDPLIRIP